MKQNGCCRNGDCGSKSSDCTGYCQWEDCSRSSFWCSLSCGDDCYTDVCMPDTIVECWLSFCPAVPNCSGLPEQR
jgi:hypothetical protein